MQEYDSGEIDNWAQDLLIQTPMLSDKIATKLVLEQADFVKQGLIETLRFLTLCAGQNGALTPSKRVDDIWHEFILFTKTYQTFCEDKYGRFIHHQPSQKDHENDIQYRHTLACYVEVFGQADDQYWPRPDASVSQCGPCEN